jgi:LPXTG-motif cell wall-anchored protein
VSPGLALLGLAALLVQTTPVEGPPPIPGVEARLVVERAEVQVGEPFRLRLEVDHPRGTSVRAAELPYGPEQGWILFERGEFVAEERSDGGGLRSVLALELAAIEQTEVTTEQGPVLSATRSVPPPSLEWRDGEHTAALPCAPGTIVATSNLRVGEDLPRGLPSLLPQEQSAATGPLWLRAAPWAGLVAALAGALLWLRRRRRSAAPRPPPTLAERRRSLDQRLRAGDPDRALVFDAVHLLRDGVDRLRRGARPGETDEEWLAGLPREEPFATLRPELRDFLHRATRARYSNDQPTSWAIEELLREALERAERLEQVPVPSGGGGQP